jgi:hypothetical protein
MQHHGLEGFGLPSVGEEALQTLEQRELVTRVQLWYSNTSTFLVHEHPQTQTGCWKCA